jgi:hypothetical protein
MHTPLKQLEPARLVSGGMRKSVARPIRSRPNRRIVSASTADLQTPGIFTEPARDGKCCIVAVGVVSNGLLHPLLVDPDEQSWRCRCAYDAIPAS